MAEQEWTDNPKPESKLKLAVAGSPTKKVKLPWPITVDKEGKEVPPPKMVDKTGKIYDRPDIIDSNQPVIKPTFAEAKAQDTLVRNRIRVAEAKKQAAIKEFMKQYEEPA
jgi:hypothetical protein